VLLLLLILILSTLLLNREVELFNPKYNIENANLPPEVTCNVIIDKSNVSYYFEGISPTPKRKKFSLFNLSM